MNGWEPRWYGGAVRSACFAWSERCLWHQQATRPAAGSLAAWQRLLVFGVSILAPESWPRWWNKIDRCRRVGCRAPAFSTDNDRFALAVGSAREVPAAVPTRLAYPMVRPSESGVGRMVEGLEGPTIARRQGWKWPAILAVSCCRHGVGFNSAAWDWPRRPFSPLLCPVLDENLVDLLAIVQAGGRLRLLSRIITLAALRSSAGEGRSCWFRNPGRPGRMKSARHFGS